MCVALGERVAVSGYETEGDTHFRQHVGEFYAVFLFVNADIDQCAIEVFLAEFL